MKALSPLLNSPVEYSASLGLWCSGDETLKAAQNETTKALLDRNYLKSSCPSRTLLLEKTFPLSF